MDEEDGQNPSIFLCYIPREHNCLTKCSVYENLNAVFMSILTRTGTRWHSAGQILLISCCVMVLASYCSKKCYLRYCYLL